MRSDFLDRMEKVLKPKPKPGLPVRAAAIALKLKAQIEREDWGDNNWHKEQALKSLDSLCGYLFHIQYRTSSARLNKQVIREQKFLREHTDVQPRTGQQMVTLPAGLMPEFNLISSPEKKAFLDQARKIKIPDQEVSNQALISAINSALKPACPEYNPFIHGLRTQSGLLSNSLKAAEHKYIMDDLLQPLKDGPISVDEFLLCCLAHSYHLQKKSHDLAGLGELAPYYESTQKAIAAFIAEILEIKSDITQAQFSEEYSELFKNKAVEMLRDHEFEASTFFKTSNFFFEHFSAKLPQSSYARLIALLNDYQNAITLEARKEEGFDISQIDPDSSAFKQQFSGQFITYKVLGSQQVAKELESKIRASGRSPREIDDRLRGFETARRRRPEQMEEVVLLHYEESAEVRKLRDRLFSKPIGSNGEDGPRTAFLKTIAAEERPALLALGLTADITDEMAASGKLPKDCGLNVEHIIDRQHGGTNHDHNFILMPAEINRQKDELKKKQINVIPDSAKGCWIISWVPKKRGDGTYPRVWPAQAYEDLSALAQMEASGPNPPQL